MSDKKGISITVLNGEAEDMKRITDTLNNDPMFSDEYSTIVSILPMKFTSVEQMVATLESVLSVLKEALPDKGKLENEVEK